MAANLDSLATEIGALRTSRDELVSALTLAVADLRESGLAPNVEILAAARDYRRRYEVVGRQVNEDRALAGLIGTESLEAWEQAVQRGQRQRKLSALFSDLRRLELRGGELPGPLSRVWETADEIHQRIEAGDQRLADDLLSGRHPLTSLLVLVREGETLADDAWSELQDRVTASFGRELSTALARGKIRLGASAPVPGIHELSEVRS